MLKEGNLSDKLEVWGFERDTVIFQDGSFGFALKLKPIDVSTYSDESLNQLSQKLRALLNGLPEKIDIQFVQEIKGGNNKTLDDYETKLLGSKNRIARSLGGERLTLLKNLDQSGHLPKDGLKLFLRKNPSVSLIEEPKLFSRKTNFEPISEDRLRREIENLERIKESLIQNLSDLDLKPQVLKSESILNEMYEQWNPGRPIEIGTYSPQDIRGSLLFSDVTLSKRGFSIYNTEYRILSLKNLPDSTYSSIARSLRALPFDSKVFLSVHIPDQQSEIESLQTQRRIAFSLASGKKDEVSDISSQAKLEDLESILEEIIANGERVFHASLNIVLKDTDEYELESKVSQSLSVIRDLSGAEGLVESYASFPIFCETSIPNARSKERIKRLKTSNLADLLPIYGSWSGHDRPDVLFRHRSGNLLKFSPFLAGPNANQLISGGSGSGKSFLTNLLILQGLKNDPKVFFIDIGGSYKKLCDHLSGQYIPFGVDQGLSINPFDLPVGESKPSSHQIKFLVGLIELMTKEEGQERLPRLVRSEIEASIQRLYDEISTPRLSDLRSILNESSEIEVRRISKILSSWCGETPFGRIIDQKTNISLDKDIIAFDLKGVEAFPELQAVCLYITTNLIWMEIQKERFQEKFLVFDECWALLKDPAACDFIESVFRTCRKYNTSAVALSQSIDDFAKSSIADAILPNCTIKWVLMQNQVSPERLKETLQLNDTEVELVKSITQKKGEFSESFLMSDKDRALAVIEATPLEMWLSTTHPKDLSLIEKWTADHPGLDRFEVLKRLAKTHPSGSPT